ncbi:MAG: hypothetical protein ABIE75_05475 [Candidatus Omnitrophota bacterium]
MNEEDDIIKNLHKTKIGYEFNLRGIPTKIEIRIDKIKRTKKAVFSQSHFIHSPEQYNSYDTSHPWSRDEQEALNSALAGFRRFYKMAVDKGHKPDDSWLILNTKFMWY